MNTLGQTAAARTGSSTPPYVRIAQILGVIDIAAPLVFSAWLFFVLPWWGAAILTLLLALLSAAILEDLQGLYFAGSRKRRNPRTAAWKTVAWAAGILPGFIWMLISAGMRDMEIVGRAIQNGYPVSELPDPPVDYGYNWATGLKMRDRHQDVGGNFEGWDGSRIFGVFNSHSD